MVMMVAKGKDEKREIERRWRRRKRRKEGRRRRKDEN